MLIRCSPAAYLRALKCHSPGEVAELRGGAGAAVERSVTGSRAVGLVRTWAGRGVRSRGARPSGGRARLQSQAPAGLVRRVELGCQVLPEAGTTRAASPRWLRTSVSGLEPGAGDRGTQVHRPHRRGEGGVATSVLPLGDHRIAQTSPLMVPTPAGS